MKQHLLHSSSRRRGLAVALLIACGGFAAPAMALQCTYDTGSLNAYRCNTSYVPTADDILYWADSAGGIQWGGTQYIASCDTNGFLNVSLYRWNGRRFEVVSGASGMCLSA